jgi:CheY-like chemotaxis protein
MANENLEILIGDDLFAEPIASRSLKRTLEPLKEYGMQLTYATTPEEVLKEAQTQKYDCIITDLDYGTTGRVGTEGFDIIDTLSQINFNPRPYIILCTSQDTHQELIQKKLQEGKLNALVGPGPFNKFTALKNYLLKHYSKKGAPAEGDKPLQLEGGEEECKK